MGKDRVIVFGVDSPIGLSIIRELGKFGVDVYGVGRSHRSIGLYSRYLSKNLILPRTLSDREIIAEINGIALEHDIRYLITVAESDISFFNHNRAALKGLTCLFADSNKMATVLSKERTYAIAQGIGIAIPKVYEIACIDDLHKIAGQIRYPLVLKWSNPHDVSQLLRRHRLPSFKMKYCYNEDELRELLNTFEPIGVYPLIQSYCPGYGLGHMIFMHRGKALLTFQHRRLHEWPPEGGSSALCISLGPDEHASVMKKSIELLRAIEWEGAAMVEYRHDPDSNTTVLMEINGRFWGSLPLAFHAGAPFAWYTYAVLGKGLIPSHKPYKIGLRCMYAIPDLKRLYLILFNQKQIQNRHIKFNKIKETASSIYYLFNFKTRFYVFMATDPMPLLKDLQFIFQKIFNNSYSSFVSFTKKIPKKIL